MTAMDAARVPFERVVAEHRGSVLRVCRSILRDEHLGADAAQETFLRLWHELASDRAPERLAPWLRRVAVGVSLDRRKARGRAEERVLIREPEREPRVERSPLDEAEAAELRGRYERALASLSESQRTIFLLRHAGGLALSEVAESLDIALATAKTHFARACLKLQAELQAFDPSRTRPT
jgi:RNA polymerase sigma factor (sigma-70 family)